MGQEHLKKLLLPYPRFPLLRACSSISRVECIFRIDRHHVLIPASPDTPAGTPMMRPHIRIA